MNAPLTPMEQGGTWATLAEGDAFLDACVASGRVTTEGIGASSDGTVMRAVRLGDGVPKALIVGSQHGREPAGREAALRLARDLAFADDAPPVPVVVIPTANPWGTRNNSRYNATGADINRTHVDLSSPESRAIASVRHGIPLIIDLHEWGASPSNLAIKGYEGVVAPMIREWADASTSAMTSEINPTVTIYPPSLHEGTMTSAVSANNACVMLVESDTTAPAESRVLWHLEAVRWLLEYGVDGAATAAALAPAWARGEGFAAHAPVFLYENGYQVAPLGYVMPADAVSPRVLELHGIRTHERWADSTDLYVPMDQDACALIPWLLDPRAPRPVTQLATPVFHEDEAAVDLSLTDSELLLPHQFVWDGRLARRIVTADGMIWGT